MPRKTAPRMLEAELAAVPRPPPKPKVAPYPQPYPTAPDRRLKWVWVVRGTFLPLVWFLPLMLGFIGFLFQMASHPETASTGAVWWVWLIPVGLIALFFLIMLAWAPLAVRNYSFAIGDDEIVVRKGVLFKTETHIPFHKVQDIVVRQGPLLRIFGLGSLNMVTAANAGPRRNLAPFSDGELPGIRDAQGLAAHLLQKVKAQHRDF